MDCGLHTGRPSLHAAVGGWPGWVDAGMLILAAVGVADTLTRTPGNLYLKTPRPDFFPCHYPILHGRCPFSLLYTLRRHSPRVLSSLLHAPRLFLLCILLPLILGFPQANTPSESETSFPNHFLYHLQNIPQPRIQEGKESSPSCPINLTRTTLITPMSALPPNTMAPGRLEEIRVRSHSFLHKI